MAPPADPRRSDALPPGTMLGRYEILRQVGGSGSTKVYEAMHRGLERRVAIKALSALPKAHREARLRFLQESEAAARVHHPNLVDVIEVVAEGPPSYVVMEYLEGETLTQLLAREAPLSVEATVALMLPVVDAIAGAHQQGAIHRCVKPSNVFLTYALDGALLPKLLNLGLSKIVGAARTMALSNVEEAADASSYLAPEQVRSAGVGDARSDQYALGAILYECLTGRRAFEGENQFATLRIISAGAFPAARSWRPDLPARLDALIGRALSLDPAARWGSVRELGAALLEHADPRVAAAWRSTFAGAPALGFAPPAFTPGASAFTPGASAFTPGASAFTPGASAFAPGGPARASGGVAAAFTPAAAPFAPRPPDFTPAPTPVAPPSRGSASLAGGTMVLGDPPARRQPEARRSRPALARGSRDSMRCLPPPPRSSRFLAVLAPALCLLVIAGAVAAVDRWGLELWREHLPTAVPGSTTSIAEPPPGALRDEPETSRPGAPHRADGPPPPVAIAPAVHPPSSPASPSSLARADREIPAKKGAHHATRRRHHARARASEPDDTAAGADQAPPSGETLPDPEK